MAQEVLMRSGGGLQGLMWSKYGLGRGAKSPLQKRQEQRYNRRVNSEPVNDIGAAEKQYSKEESTSANDKLEMEKRFRSQSVPNGDSSLDEDEDGGSSSKSKGIEIYDVLGKMKLDPNASLEEEGSCSNSPKAQGSPKRHSDPNAGSVMKNFFGPHQIMRIDSFEVGLRKKIQDVYKGCEIKDGELVHTASAGGEEAKASEEGAAV